MAEYKEGQGIKTHRDNDLAGKIVDGQSGATATHILSIVGEGDTVTGDTNDFGIPQMVKKEDGTYCIPAADDNCALKVVVVDEADDNRVHSYYNHSDVAASGGTDDHDMAAIPNGHTVNEIEVMASSPGCFKYEIGEYDGVSVFTVHAVIRTQPASPTFGTKKICLPTITGDGTKHLRIKTTNNDTTNNDADTTVCYKTVSA